MESDNNNLFIYVLNIQILRGQIFQHLSFKDKSHLRGVSRAMKCLIDEDYWPEIKIINIRTTFDSRWNCESFKIGLKALLRQTRSLRVFNSCGWNGFTNDLIILILKLNPYLNNLNISTVELSLNSSIFVHGSNLKVLSFPYCQLHFISLEGIELNEIKLEKLEISLNNDSYTSWAGVLRKCEHLQALILNASFWRKEDKSGNFDEGRISHYKHSIFLGNLACCENIESLNLPHCSLTNSMLEAISKLKNLKQLVLDHCALPIWGERISVGFGYIKACENLEILSLNDCTWGNDVLEALTHYQNLRKLFLKDYKKLKRRDINNLTSFCPNLEVLFISCSTYVGRECFLKSNVVIHVMLESPWEINRFCPSYEEHYSSPEIN